MNFLAAWRAWSADPRRPGLLHFVSIDACPVSAADLLQSAAPYPELSLLAQQLSGQWFGLMPGFHRLTFERGRVLLTLCIGDPKALLRQQDFAADSIFLDAFSEQPNPGRWELHTLKSVARLCRRGTSLAIRPMTGSLQQDLAQCGFALAEADDGLAPNRHSPQAVFAPAWPRKGLWEADAVRAGSCVVIGAGLAGAAAAASLARRGWQVRVLDAAQAPASGASALPAGLLAPHHSPDDNLLSRLCRSGVRMTLQQAQAWLQEGQDWQASGVLEHRFDASRALPADGDEPGLVWSRRADAQQKRQALLAGEVPALWHEKAAWIKPAALVRAWLAQPGIAWSGGAHVKRIVRQADGWKLLDAQGAELAGADLVVVAAAHASAALLPAALPLQQVRGQVSWALHDAGQNLPPFPVNGDGYFIPGVPLGDRAVWLCGSTFARDETDLAARIADHSANFQRVCGLLPEVAQQLAPAFTEGSVQAWCGVRCASADRRPLVGELEPGLWVSTAMGSRGLTFAMLCAELLAARLHGEPLPLPRKLAASLETGRTQAAGKRAAVSLRP